MPRLLDKLLSHPKVTTRDPASQDDIHALAKQFDAPIPLTLAALWRTSDGLDFGSLKASLHGPATSLDVMQNSASGSAWFDCGWLPFFDDQTSNYLAINLHEPLAYRVIYLPHDDEKRLVYRDVESCIRSLLGICDSPKTKWVDFDNVEGDYAPDGERTEEDQEAAKFLLNAPHKHDEWNLAIQLLDHTDLSAWGKVLETEHFIRRDAVARMKKMHNPAIQELLRQDQQEFNTFVQLAAQALDAAGIKTGERHDTVLNVKGKWYEMESFFYKRNKSHAFPKMINWIQDQLADRNPYDRPDHFHSDKS